MTVSRYPYEAQLKAIKETKRKDNILKEQEIFKRKVSCLISFLTLPVIYVSNIVIYVLIKHNGFKYDPNIVMSEAQLEQVIFYFLTPMFLMSLLSSAMFYTSDEVSFKTFKRVGTVAKYVPLLGTLIIIITSSSVFL